MENPRELKGRPGAGRWVKKVNSEADLDLEDDVLGEITHEDFSEQAPLPYDASADEIRNLVDSPDHVVRAELPSYPNVTDDVLERLQQPDQELTTRQSVLATMYPGVAERASNDDHPLIRAHALHTGWDLHDSTRKRLEKDGGVQHVMEIISR